MQVNSSVLNSAYRFNIIYIVFIVLWPLFQESLFEGIDGAGRIGWIMMILAVSINEKHFFQVPKIMLLWGIWILYNIVMSLTKGFYLEGLPFSIWAINALIKPFISMLVVYHAYRQNGDKTLKVLFYCWLIYVFLGLAFMHGSTKSVMGEDVTRQNNELGNTFVNSSIFLLTFGFCSLYKNIISKKIFFFSCILEVTVILLSGSRKGILAIFIIFFLSYIGRNFNMGFKQFFRVGLISALAYGVVQIIMSYTIAGTRIQAGQEMSNYEDNWFLSLMGDRGFMYDYGWQLFLEHPLTGIGLQNFRWQNALGIVLALHTEYMVQICECGIIGLSLFLIFYYGMAKRIKRLLFNTVDRHIAFVILSSFLGFLLLSLVAWTYSFVYYFVFFGFIYAYYENTQKIGNQFS